MSFLMLASSALGLGFVHGLGADHLMAIAALAVDGRPERRNRVVPTAVGFAVGHMVVLGLGATIALVFGIVVPVAVESGAERVGGALLVLLGIIGLWGVYTGRAYGHVHQEIAGPARWHLHIGRAHHAHHHSPVPTAMGAVFAVSSLRALMLLEPFGASAHALALPVVLLLVMLFGVGILLSMSIFGVLLARAMSIRAVLALGRAAGAVVALASVGLGIYWSLGA